MKKFMKVKILTMFWIVSINACAPFQARYDIVTKDCLLFKEVPMEEPVKDWFIKARPKTDSSVIRFLDRVADNNERLASHCKQ